MEYYGSGRASDADKEMILAERETIINNNVDVHNSDPSDHASFHEDKGIGLDFPL
jgi:hypothetical protein